MNYYDIVIDFFGNGALVFEFLLPLKALSYFLSNIFVDLFLALHQPTPNRIVCFELSGE